MDDIGHLYVLANSAMPGLVKVGKTTRSPSERASELSSATGLPSPFIVVYEQLFSDCSAAESFVHAYLSAKGFRISDNREFFSAPVNDVVRAIALAPNSIDISALASTVESTPYVTDKHEADELSDMQLSPSPSFQRQPWEAVFEEAEDHYAGSGNLIQDFRQAMRLFQQAAKLGSLPAYGQIGYMYIQGKGVPVDEAKALECFKEGARKGSTYCYWAMGMVFFRPNSIERQNIHMPNVEKCFSLFLEKWKNRVVDRNQLTEFQLEIIYGDCMKLLNRELNSGVKAPLGLKDFFIERSAQIKMFAQNAADHAKQNGHPGVAQAFQTVADHFRISSS